MDKFIVPVTKAEKPKPIKRERWKRSRIELEGKFDSKYRHHTSSLLMQSYSQIGSFAHSFLIGGEHCPNHVQFRAGDFTHFYGKHGISAIEFDRKGIYLAIVTKEGCLTVLDFESLYSKVNFEHPSGLKKDESMHLFHIPKQHELDAVRWNLANQDEVACTSLKSKDVLIFDIGYISTDPIEVLSRRIPQPGSSINKGFSDIAFSSNSRVFASDMHGVNVWDRRKGKLPCHGFLTDSSSILNSIQVIEENQIIIGASNNGILYMWDLRGGRSSTAFQSEKKASYSPLASIKLASELEKVGSLKAQSNIIPNEIHTININPSCQYQLAFHLDDGWSGVLDIHNFKVTHVHCPPPPWLMGEDVLINLSCLRKPSWLSPYSIYAVGSAHSKGIYLLDFYPDTSSPCHTEYKEDIESHRRENNQQKQNRYMPLSESVTACAAHPLNGTIVAGTDESSLLVISQKIQPMEQTDA